MSESSAEGGMGVNDALRTQIDRLPALYRRGGEAGHWTGLERNQNPDLPYEYARLLTTEGILPLSDRANGFVFYSPSAHQGFYEYAIAKAVNDSLTQPLANSPQFIASDFFGKHKEEADSTKFVPGFIPQRDQAELAFVKFQKIAADAQKLPLADGSVTVLWDRLGALWHLQEARRKHKVTSQEEIEELLTEYKRVLAPNGCLLIDTATPHKGASISTYDILRGNLNAAGPIPNDLKDSFQEAQYNVDFKNLDWETRFIGKGKTRLAILTPARREGT